MLKIAKKIYNKLLKNGSISSPYRESVKSSPYREPAKKQPELSTIHTQYINNEKTEVISLIIKSEETIPITVTMSFNKIEQTESGKRCEYVINDKSVITIERGGNIESIKSLNLLARLFIDR